MTIEVYISEQEDGDVLLVVEKDKPVQPNSYDPLKDMTNPKLLTTIEGDDWNHCMTQHHTFMGWEPFKPN